MLCSCKGATAPQYGPSMNYKTYILYRVWCEVQLHVFVMLIALDYQMKKWSNSILKGTKESDEARANYSNFGKCCWFF